MMRPRALLRLTQAHTCFCVKLFMQERSSADDSGRAVAGFDRTPAECLSRHDASSTPFLSSDLGKLRLELNSPGSGTDDSQGNRDEACHHEAT